jgi:hypothetical protein
MSYLSPRSNRRRIAKNVDNILSRIRQPGQDLGVRRLVRQGNPYLSQSISVDRIQTVGNNQICITPPQSSSDLPDENLCLNLVVNEQEPYVIDNFKTNFVQWAIKHNITHSALKELLPHIQQLRPDLNIPLDPRTLLSTPRQVDKTILGDGEYCHFGLEYQIRERISDKSRACKLPNVPWIPKEQNIITITLGIDGVPVSRSSNNQFWPILGVVDQATDNSPFVIGLFYGETKPNPCSLFLKQTISELKHLEELGIDIRGKLYKVRLRCVIADAPARSYLKLCPLFNGYNGCERCRDKGTWLGRVVFLNLNSRLRKDSECQSVSLQERSPFCSLKFGLVSQFPLDYMHLVCLGVMRKFLFAWTKGKIPHKLSQRQITEVSSSLVDLVPHIPSEFCRKPRSLREIDHFKATEYRTFLLYTGPLVLREFLPQEKYEHFLILSSAIHILISPRSNLEWISFSEKLLYKFVSDTSRLYSKEFLIYNLHSLIHLANDVRQFGPLDNISAFKFENYMQTLKKMTRSSNHKLEQVANRLAETMKSGYVKVNPSVNCKSGGLASSVGYIGTNTGDNCFFTDQGEVVIAISIDITSKTICVKRFRKQFSVPMYPFDSKKIGIISVSELSNSTVNVDSSRLSRKCVLLPDKNNTFLCIPLIHSILE